MADLVMTDGRSDLRIECPSPSGLAALEHLGWSVKSGTDPRKPKRQTRKTTKTDD